LRSAAADSGAAWRVLGVALFLAYTLAALFARPDHALLQWLLYLPPLAVNLALCWLFGRTLVRGRTPLIARFAEIEQGSLSGELAAHARTVTWLWALLCGGAALTSLLLALSGERDAWSLFTNLGNYVLVAALFLGEIAYRRMRFRNYRHQSALQLLRNVRRTKLFER
jgi:uncharacterized membrane protein